MIEGILFVLAYLATWPALVILCLLGIWSEHSESRGFAVFWALVAAASAFFYFNVPLVDLVFYAAGYLAVGLVWSFYRYRRFIVEKVAYLREFGLQEKVKNFHPSKMLDTISAWIIIWPFSMAENVCGDIINGIETLVKKVFRGVYNRIYDAAVSGDK